MHYPSVRAALQKIAQEKAMRREEGANAYKDPRGGMTSAGRAKFRREEGSNLKPGMKEKNPSGESAKRKGSFLKDEKGRPTRLAPAAREWGEKPPANAQQAQALANKGEALLRKSKEASMKTAEELYAEAVHERRASQERGAGHSKLGGVLADLFGYGHDHDSLAGIAAHKLDQSRIGQNLQSTKKLVDEFQKERMKRSFALQKEARVGTALFGALNKVKGFKPPKVAPVPGKAKMPAVGNIRARPKAAPQALPAFNPAAVPKGGGPDVMQNPMVQDALRARPVGVVPPPPPVRRLTPSQQLFHAKSRANPQAQRIVDSMAGASPDPRLNNRAVVGAYNLARSSAGGGRTLGTMIKTQSARRHFQLLKEAAGMFPTSQGGLPNIPKLPGVPRAPGPGAKGPAAQLKASQQVGIPKVARAAAMRDELAKLNAVQSPEAQITRSQKVGENKLTTKGPSVQMLAKPVGFGTPQPGAIKPERGV